MLQYLTFALAMALLVLHFLAARSKTKAAALLKAAEMVDEAEAALPEVLAAVTPPAPDAPKA